MFFFFFLHKQAGSANLAWEKKTHLFLTCCVCDLLFRCLTTRCLHNTDRGLSLSPVRAQPPPGGSCGSTRLLFISPLCGHLERPESNSDDSGRVSSAGIQQTDPAAAGTNKPGAHSLSEVCFSRKWFTWSFPSDGEGLELERKDATGRRFKWREAEINPSQSYKFNKVFMSLCRSLNSSVT